MSHIIRPNLISGPTWLLRGLVRIFRILRTVEGFLEGPGFYGRLIP
ncbi:MAG: hypothetical protein M1537_07640 [Nitrospirae bacterium]|nr:MAG: hypothetical protein D084_Lepto4C00434G0002 [Leptospirillum sp. Group IV 'UBA BS']MCL4486179.1 hypothetical protein [Nitrospirota bacterium]MCL5285463.1 hypothetical protein [Nitrospirota bacterium]